jgi:hypothetical protein
MEAVRKMKNWRRSRPKKQEAVWRNPQPKLEGIREENGREINFLVRQQA